MLSDVDLIARLTSTEDAFVERKSAKDKGGWLRTAVAFANSTPIGYPAVLFIGVADDGTIAEGLRAEDVMKSFSDCIAENAWPPIYSAPRVVTQNGLSCIAAIIPGSENRPHFAGRSYVRDGTQTRDASDEQFQGLIAERSNKVREILKWRGKQVTHETRMILATTRRTIAAYWVLQDCNKFYLTFTSTNKDSSDTKSLPISDVEISFDDKYKQLKLVTKE